MCIQLLETTERAQGTCTLLPKYFPLGRTRRKHVKKSPCEQDTGSKLKSEGEGGKGSELAGSMSSIKITLFAMTT